MENRIEYIDIDSNILWEDNPKSHDIGSLVLSIEKYGFRDAPIYDINLNGGKGGLIGGSGRTEALRKMRLFGMAAPSGIVVKEGAWLMPVQFGPMAKSEKEAIAFAIDHNNLVMAGGSFTAIGIASAWDSAEYIRLLQEIHDEPPVTVTGDDLDTLLRYASSLLESDTAPPPDGSGGKSGAKKLVIKITVKNRADLEDISANIPAIFEKMGWDVDFDFPA